MTSLLYCSPTTPSSLPASIFQFDSCHPSMASLKELSPSVQGNHGMPSITHSTDQNTTIQASQGTSFSLLSNSSKVTYFCSNQLVYTCTVERQAAHTPNEFTLANHQLWEGSGGSSSYNEGYSIERWLSQSEREEGVVVYTVRSSSCGTLDTGVGSGL